MFLRDFQQGFAMNRKVKACDEDLRGWTKDAFNEALSFRESCECFIFLKYAFQGGLMLMTKETQWLAIREDIEVVLHLYLTIFWVLSMLKCLQQLLYHGMIIISSKCQIPTLPYIFRMVILWSWWAELKRTQLWKRKIKNLIKNGVCW